MALKPKIEKVPRAPMWSGRLDLAASEELLRLAPLLVAKKKIPSVTKHALVRFALESLTNTLKKLDPNGTH